MSVKLSELLETATNSIGAAARRDEQFCNTAALLWSQESALRAIAPALVELVAATDAWMAAEEAGERCNFDQCVRAEDRLADASEALLTLMEEAGVTCE